MINYSFITSSSEIESLLKKTGHSFQTSTYSEPITIEKPLAIIDIKEKSAQNPTQKEMMEIIAKIGDAGRKNVKTYDTERNALIAIYEAANGKKWNKNTNWCQASIPVSNWYGIRTSTEYVFVQGNKIVNIMGNVKHINLSHNNIHCGKLEDNGRISPYFKDLTEMTVLNLSYNFIHGIIPEELYTLTKLEELSLHFNQLEGGISSKIGDLKRLRILHLDHNHLSEPIPAQIGNLSKLEQLYLHFNNLDNDLLGIKLKRKPGATIYRKTINIPASLANLSKLKTFYAYKNQLSGTIPALLKKHPHYNQWQIKEQQNNITLK